MDGKLENAMAEFWENYLNPDAPKDDRRQRYVAPPNTYARGFQDGIKYASKISPDEFICPACNHRTYPNHDNRCGFCGVGSKP